MNTNTCGGLGRARVKRLERHQMEWRPLALDQCLPSDHRARVVWAYVDSLDLSPVYEKIRAVDAAGQYSGVRLVEEPPRRVPLEQRPTAMQLYDRTQAAARIRRW